MRLNLCSRQFLSWYWPKMAHRIGIFILKLVCVENFMLYGPSGSKLSYFQNLAFPIHFNGICCFSEIFLTTAANSGQI